MKHWGMKQKHYSPQKNKGPFFFLRPLFSKKHSSSSTTTTTLLFLDRNTQGVCHKKKYHQWKDDVSDVNQYYEYYLINIFDGW